MKFGLLTLTLCILAPGAPAGAVINLATYTGTIGKGFDHAGMFGVDGDDLAGQGFVAKYVYDTELGDKDGLSYSANSVYNSAPGQRSPVLRAELTINGYTRIIARQDYSSINVDQNGYFSLNASDVAFDYDSKVSQMFNRALLPIGANSASSTMPLTSASGTGGFAIWVSDEFTGRPIYGLSGTMETSSISVKPVTTVRTATYVGTISTGFDHAGMFGVDGDDLTGQGFVAKYVYDTALGDKDALSYSSSNVFNSAPGQSSPVLRAELTINGYTRIIASQDYSSINVDQNGYFSLNATDVAFDYDSKTSQMFNRALLPIGANSASSTMPLTLASGTGGFAIWLRDEFTGRPIYGLSGTMETSSISVAGNVPEPSSWMLMIVGMGAVGVAARSRQRAVAPQL